MSTILYAAITNTRAASEPGEAFTDGTEANNKDPKKTFIDALAALVPAEVLALHSFAIAYATKTENKVVTITNMGLLKDTFVALIGLSLLLYAARRYLRGGGWEPWDFARLFIPALAFVGWTMLQPTSAFDAVSDLPQGYRAVGAAILAILLGLLASWLAYKVDGKKPAQAAPTRR